MDNRTGPQLRPSGEPSGLCQAPTLRGSSLPAQGSAPRGMETGGSRLGSCPRPLPSPTPCPLSRLALGRSAEGIHTALEPARDTASSPSGTPRDISPGGLHQRPCGPGGAGTGAVPSGTRPTGVSVRASPWGSGPETQKALCLAVQWHITVKLKEQRRRHQNEQ